MSSPTSDLSKRMAQLESTIGAVQRTTLGSSFTKAIRVLVLPTGAVNGRHLLLDGGTATASAFIAVFDATSAIAVMMNEAGVRVGPDFQLGESTSVALNKGGIDNPGNIPWVEIKPGNSVGGNWLPSTIYTNYVANAGGTSEQNVLTITGPVPKPEQSATTPPSIQLWSLSRDGVAHADEINILTQIFAIYDLTRANIFATFRGGVTGGTSKLKLQSPQGLAFNRMIDFWKTGDGNPGWTIDGDGKQQWGPGGAIAPDVNLYRASPSVLATDDTFAIAIAGKGHRIKEGANATMGLAVLVAGTVVVNTSAVGANTRIFLTCQVPGGTPGFLQVSARVAGTSFTILSSNAADTSSVAWLLIEPH